MDRSPFFCFLITLPRIGAGACRSARRATEFARPGRGMRGWSSRYIEPAQNVASLPFLAGSPLDDREGARVSEWRTRSGRCIEEPVAQKSSQGRAAECVVGHLDTSNRRRTSLRSRSSPVRHSMTVKARGSPSGGREADAVSRSPSRKRVRRAGPRNAGLVISPSPLLPAGELVPSPDGRGENGRTPDSSSPVGRRGRVMRERRPSRCLSSRRLAAYTYHVS